MRSSKPQPSWSLGLAAALVLVSATLCRAQFAELAARVPDGANAVFIIDVDQIMRSQLATNQGWSTKQQAMYEAGLLMVPPEASQVLAATKLDFETMRPEWQVFLMNLKREPAMSQLAERYNGTLDKWGATPWSCCRASPTSHNLDRGWAASANLPIARTSHGG